MVNSCGGGGGGERITGLLPIGTFFVLMPNLAWREA